MGYKLKTLRLILGDQLNINHSWFSDPDINYIYVMMEIKDETNYVKHHIQKILGIFAAMRNFNNELLKKKYKTIYLKISDQNNKQNFIENLKWIINKYNIESFEYQEPDEYRLDKLFKSFSNHLKVNVKAFNSEHFLNSRNGVKDFFSGKKQWRMEYFYRFMRKEHNVLIDSDLKPHGGKWNFDVDNRKSWNGDPKAAIDLRPNHNLKNIYDEINFAGIKFFGNCDYKNYRWPINRNESLKLLEGFIKNNLINFGDYQDAMHDQNWFLFHSFLSFSLNTKMLSPMEVINQVERAFRKKKLPLASVEGFIRQILGWREYVRGIYWAFMPGYDKNNYFSHEKSLPDWYWSGDTKMNCLSKSIKQSLDHAYAHHIQRLMVVGNFSLLAGIKPEAIHQWYLGIYIDAFEWVELPNTLGMSQFADGGQLASKPYVSSASYINKMSNYCKSCHYDFKVKIGENACPYNSLYWNFFEKHKDKLGKNQRLGIVYNNLRKMSSEQKQQLIKQSQKYLKKLNTI